MSRWADALASVVLAIVVVGAGIWVLRPTRVTQGLLRPGDQTTTTQA